MFTSVAHISNDKLDTLTFAEIIDYHAEYNPDYPFTVFPGAVVGENVSRISYLEFGRATQRFARAIYPDAPVKQREVVGVIVNADSLMWTTAVAGLIRAGSTAFPISPRNSPAAICHILRTVSSHRLIVTESSLQSLVDDVKAELAASGYALAVKELPTLDTIYPHLASETTKHEFEPIALPPRSGNPNEVVMYIHSSGSTGFPKSIPIPQEMFFKLSNDTLVEPHQSYDKPYFLGGPGLPDFHVVGIWLHLLHPLYTGRPCGIFRPTAPRPPPISSPETIMAALKALKPTRTFVIPSLLEAWFHDPDAVAFLKTIDEIVYAGGPLSSAVGDALVAQGVGLRTGYGTTETGFLTDLRYQRHAPDEWAWAELHHNVDVRWQPQGDGTFELQVLRGEKHIVHVENLPDVRGYATQDLWVPHPTKEGLWRIVGRVDDVLILANGEKVVPAPIEGKILAHPFVHGAVAFGRERSQIGVLVEPTEAHAVDPADEGALAAFRNAIWPAVEEANRVSPAFGRVYKEMILVVSPDKLLPRAAKGTVTRKAALALYDAEIRALYDAVERPAQGSDVAPPDSWGVDDVSAWLSSLAASIRDGQALEKNVDLFEQGFDSLSATFLRNHIIGALRGSSESTSAAKIDNGFVYAHPTISGMASVIVSFINPDSGTAASDPTDDIRAMIAEYSQDLPQVAPLNTPQPERQVVLITGSTRGLGSQLLSSLITDDKVERVYALNRPLREQTSLARHEQTFRDRDLDASVLSSPKLVLLEGETGHEHLGLSVESYEELRNSVTIIIHNAWRLDFNLALSSFDSAVRGTRNLLELAMTSPHAAHVRMFFTSSIAVSQSWPRSQGAFPEEPQADARWCVGSGYGESKYVCEQLLAKAAERGLHTTSFRLGQICGSQRAGTWAVTDWVPILVRSSVALGCLPDAQGVMSWISPEAVSGTILDVALGADTPERALNVVHPRPIAWSSMMGVVADELVRHGITEDRLPLVETREWFAKLAEAADGADEAQLKNIPAIKLLDFFRAQADADTAARAAGAAGCEAGGLTTLATTKSQRASRTMRGLESLGGEDVGRWIGYWKAAGLFGASK